MNRRVFLPVTTVVIATALMFTVPAAYAVPIPFGTILSGGNEVPPNSSPGSGTAVVVLDPTAQTLQVVASFFGLTTGDTAAHIHCCAPLGTNAGVATTMPAFPAFAGLPGFPLGVTQGAYVSAPFSLTDPLIYNPGFVTAQGGLPQAEAALITGIEGGMSYFNIHTTANMGGEIRGQLEPLGAVPEPTTLLLLGTTLTGLAFAWRRRRQG